MAFLGKEVRLRRLFNKKSGHLLAIALDHAIGWGVIEGIEKIQETVDIVAAAEPDAITMQKGIAEKCMGPWAGRQPFILKCSSFSPFYPCYDGYTGAVEEAVRLGADAVALGVTIGGKEQPELLKNLAMFTEKASLYGLPVVTHIYPKGELIPRRREISLQTCRLRGPGRGGSGRGYRQDLLYRRPRIISPGDRLLSGLRGRLGWSPRSINWRKCSA